MRIDLLEDRVTRLIKRIQAEFRKENPGARPREVSRDIARDVLLRNFKGVVWAEKLKGLSLDFGVSPIGSSEEFFVDGNWEFSEYNRHFSRSEWPRSRWSSPDDAEVVIRRVGRSSGYVQAVRDQIASLAAHAPWVRGVEKLILDGSTSNTRARRVRARRQAELDGQEISGTEVQMERTFVARRSSNGFPLAAWKLGYRIFFPTARTVNLRDAVPVLQLELLDDWEWDSLRPASLDAVFLNMFKKSFVEALISLGPVLDGSPDIFPDGGDLPLALRVCLPPEMESSVPTLLAALMSLFDEDGYSRAFVDANLAIHWVEVVSLDVAPGAIKAKEDAIAMEKKVALDATKAAVRPGDEFMFLEIEVREYCVDSSGLYFPAVISQVREMREEEYGGTVEEILEDYEVDIASLVALQDPEEVWKLLKEIANVPPSENINELVYVLRDALWVASAGEVRPATGMRLFVLVDRSTGAQAVELVKGHDKSLAYEFLKRATSIPVRNSVPSARPSCVSHKSGDGFDPGGLTLLTRPKRLLVAKSYLNECQEIRKWCAEADVEIVHPKTGLGSMASTARVWHADLSRLIHDDKIQSTGLTFEALAQRVSEVCWVLNEVKSDEQGFRYVPGYYSGQKGAKVELYCAWRAPLVSAAWARENVI